MNKRKGAGLWLCLIILLFLGGCRQTEPVKEEDLSEIADVLEPENEEWTRLEAEELESLLIGATAIEMKTTDNQSVGMLTDREEIRQFVEGLFEYPFQEQYPQDDAANQVEGPINFYLDGTDDIYGIVKNKYIYVEGYYFLISESNLNEVKVLFQGNQIEQAPNGS